jgi:hypothetical protein
LNEANRIGALGIENTAIHGPEAGILGLALNIAFATALWLSRPRVGTAQGGRGRDT